MKHGGTRDRDSRWRFSCQLRDRALAERRKNPLAHAPQRGANVAFPELLAGGAFVGRTGRDGNRAVDGLDDIGDGNLLGCTSELIAPARALLRRQEAAAYETLQHLGEELDRNVVLLRNLTGARRAARGAVSPHG